MENSKEKYKIAVIAILLIICLLITYYYHFILRIEAVFTHFFYIPIILAGLWWSRKGIAVAVFLALLLLISHIISPLENSIGPNLSRSLMFVVVGTVAALLNERMQTMMAALRAKEKIRENEERLRAIFNTAEDCIYTKDFTLKYTSVNPAMERLFRLPASQLIGQTDDDLFGEEAASRIRAVDSRVLKGEIIEMDIIKPVSGIPITFHTVKVPIRDSSGEIAGLCGIARDITERKSTEEKLVHMTTHDPLTGLPNRTLFNDRLTQELAHAHRNRKKLAVMLLDLDEFKDINDTSGHSMGDRVLKAAGERLTRLFRKSDTVARMGGDEFLLLLPEISVVEDTTKIAEQILEAFRRPFIIDDREFHITTSIGIAIFPDDGEDVDILIRNADIAMYRAKDRGRDNCQRYTPS